MTEIIPLQVLASHLFTAHHMVHLTRAGLWLLLLFAPATGERAAEVPVLQRPAHPYPDMLSYGERRLPGRSLLVGDDPEGFGLYSYILFRNAPDEDEAAKKRYRAAIKSYLKISHVEDVASFVRQAQVNVTYMPVNGRPDGEISEDWVLTNYNFDRARRLLAKVPELDGDGPFVVATPRPLSGSSPVARPYFHINLTKVDPKFIDTWISYFLDQTSHEQYWKEDTMHRFVLELRNALAQLADGEDDAKKGFDYWKLQVLSFVTFASEVEDKIQGKGKSGNETGTNPK